MQSTSFLNIWSQEEEIRLTCNQYFIYKEMTSNFFNDIVISTNIDGK